jgi:hypothetical protein
MTKQPTDIQIDFADIYPSTQQQKKQKKQKKQKPPKVSTPENIDIGEIYETQEQKEQKKTQKKNKQNKQSKQKKQKEPEFELSQVYDNTNIVPISSSAPSSTWVMPSSILLAVVMLVSTLAISTRRKGN